MGLPTTHHSVSQQQQQQQHQSSSGAHMVTAHYGMQPVAHDPNGLRAYHHPDTPGGLDVRTNQHPFAFFKMPPGAPLHHPSAYNEQQHVPHSSGNNINSGGSGSSQMSSSRSQMQLSGGSNGSGSKTRQQQQQQQQLGIRDRRPVPPAVGGLSVRILSHDHNLADAPRSAPVDGPDMKKRKISHDEVIMALRRKVMSKGGVAGTHALSLAQASAAQPSKGHPLQAASAAAQNSNTQRRSSLAVITQSSSTGEGDDDPCEAAGTLSSSSSSSSSSPSLMPSTASSPLLRTTAGEDRKESMLETRVGIVVDGALAHEYILAAEEGTVWKIESTSAPPLLRCLTSPLPLLSSLDLGNGRLVPGTLGLTPSYQPTTSFSVRVQLVSERGSGASPELWVKKNGDCTLEQLDVCESDVEQGDADRRAWTAQWLCGSVRDEGLHMSLHVRQSADTLSALEGRRHDDRTPRVLDLFISKFTIPSDSDSPIPPLATLPLDNAKAQMLPTTHVFYETLRHHEHRSSNSGDVSAHPLFGRWVAEDSPAFRSAISGMEEQALSNRTHYKDLARQSTGLRDAYQMFMRQLSESLALLESMPVLEPLVSMVIQPLKHDIAQMLSTLCNDWDFVVVACARKLYESSFKQLEERKSEFDNASEQYYTELSKYLKAKASKEDERRDEAFNRLRVGFDSARCIYFVDLWCASHGWSQLEMFTAVLKWSQSIILAREAPKLPLSDNLGKVSWLLDNIEATADEMKQQRVEVAEFKAIVENPGGLGVRDYNLSPGGEMRESDEYVRVSLEQSFVPTAKQLLQLPTVKDARSKLSALRLSAVQSPDQIRQLLSSSHAPPMPSTSAASGNTSASLPTIPFPVSKSIDLTRHSLATNRTAVGAVASDSSVREGIREGYLFARIGSSKHSVSTTTNRGMMGGATGNSVWRRYWCQVGDGRFQKFAAQGKSTSGSTDNKGDTLSLATATVRTLSSESKQSSRRRFCFELITPSYYGVFQATSDHDLAMWIEVLRRGIELSLLHNNHASGSLSSLHRQGVLTPAEMSEGRSSRDRMGSGARFSRAASHFSSGYESMTTLASSVNASSASISGRDSHEVSATETSPMPPAALLPLLESEPLYGALGGQDFARRRRRLSVAELLPMLQAGDEANEYCADCGTRQPEWCSLNLGCLLCIECSGIHRSLGTHISKVRSLTLDVTSFTPVTIAMMLATGNPLNALVFERQDGSGHPGPDSSRQMRQQHIEAKYVERRFVDREWRPVAETSVLFDRIVAEQSVFVVLAAESTKKGGGTTTTGVFWTAEMATVLLFAAIEAGDMIGVMRALALGASINSGRLRIANSEHRASPLLAALFGIEQLTSLFSSAPTTESLESTSYFRVHLEIAELLILNGAFVNIPDDIHGFTPLHMACLADNAGVVKYLTDKGADPLVPSTDGRLALAMLLPPGERIPSAARAIITGATQRAEERVRLDAAKSPVHSTTHFGASSRVADTRGPVPRRGSSGSGGGITGRSAFESRHSGSADGMGDRPLFDNGRSENSVFSAARRFTQSLVPSPAIGSAGSRMSVSTERPSLMEIGGLHHMADGTGGGPQSGGGWLASLAGAGSMNKRGRRLTSGIRELGSRFGGTGPPGAVAIAGARGADTGCGADVPPLPTILSAREEAEEDEEEDLLSAADEDSDDEVSELDTAAASRSAPNVTAAVIPSNAAKVPVPPIPEEDTPVAHASVRSTRSNMALNQSRGSGKHRNISPIYQIFGSGTKSAAASPTRPHHRRSGSSLLSTESESNSFVEVIDTPTVRASKHSNALGAAVLHRRELASGLRVSNSAEAFASPVHRHRRHEPPPLPDNPLLGLSKGGVAQASGGNKLMLRLLPRSSRMAFTGIFGRSDKKSTCPSDASATPMPHYSELLNRVGSACDVGIDELSDRLLATLSQQRSEEGASRHWRTSLARISDEWSWAQQKLAWPAQHGASVEAAGADSAAGDLAVCAAMCFVLWWFGVWLVRQWSRDMAGAFSQLRHQPPRPLGPSNKEADVAIEIGD
ncbi:hypothetical protein H4R27_002381 [Coemansia aciculifera]|nr:hypothetical protein H4R27_002381 [Coemansia aciculifera]